MAVPILAVKNVVTYTYLTFYWLTTALADSSF